LRVTEAERDRGQTPKRRGRPPAGGREAIRAAALTLLRERGIARLNTREVATLAGVSEASVFYHYGDRAGLLMAVFEEGLRPLQALSEAGALTGADVRDVLTRLGTALETFLYQGLPITTAAQSDSELRDALAAYMREHDLGSHRGVRALGDYLAGQQATGRIRPDVDAYAVALLFVGACFTRVSHRLMPVSEVDLPGLDDIIAATDAMLRLPQS
jgi:AcrR family transcriptional regulator